MAKDLGFHPVLYCTTPSSSDAGMIRLLPCASRFSYPTPGTTSAWPEKRQTPTPSFSGHRACPTYSPKRTPARTRTPLSPNPNPNRNPKPETRNSNPAPSDYCLFALMPPGDGGYGPRRRLRRPGRHRPPVQRHPTPQVCLRAPACPLLSSISIDRDFLVPSVFSLVGVVRLLCPPISYNSRLAAACFRFFICVHKVAPCLALRCLALKCLSCRGVS